MSCHALERTTDFLYTPHRPPRVRLPCDALLCAVCPAFALQFETQGFDVHGRAAFGTLVFARACTPSAPSTMTVDVRRLFREMEMEAEEHELDAAALDRPRMFHC